MVYKKRQPPIGKGKGMLKIQTKCFKNSYRLFNLQGAAMPSANAADWSTCVCLNIAGLSGCLEPSTIISITEYPD